MGSVRGAKIRGCKPQVKRNVSMERIDLLDSFGKQCKKQRTGDRTRRMGWPAKGNVVPGAFAKECGAHENKRFSIPIGKREKQQDCTCWS